MKITRLMAIVVTISIASAAHGQEESGFGFELKEHETPLDRDFFGNDKERREEANTHDVESAVTRDHDGMCLVDCKNPLSNDRVPMDVVPTPRQEPIIADGRETVAAKGPDGDVNAFRSFEQPAMGHFVFRDDNRKVEFIGRCNEYDGHWQVQAGSLHAEATPKNETRAKVGPTESHEYQRGMTGVVAPSDKPASGQKDGHGESIFEAPGNTPSREPRRPDGHEHGLPSGERRNPPSTPEELARDTVADAKRWAGAFAEDLRAASDALDNGRDALNNANQGAKGKHNDAIRGLNQKLGVSPDGPGASDPRDPPLPPADDRDLPQTRTPPSSPHYSKLQDAINYRNQVASGIGAPHETEKRDLLDVADLGIGMADASYAEGSETEGDKQLKTALMVLDTILDFTPVLGTAKDVLSLATGTNIITGDKLSGLEITVIAAGLLAPAVISGATKVTAKMAAKASRFAAKSKAAKNIVKAVEEADEQAVKILGKSPCGMALVDCDRVVGSVTDLLNDSVDAGLKKLDAKRIAEFDQISSSLRGLSEKGVPGADDLLKQIEGFERAVKDAAATGADLKGPVSNLKGCLGAADAAREAAKEGKEVLGINIKMPGGKGDVDLATKEIIGGKAKTTFTEIKTGNAVPRAQNPQKPGDWDRFVQQTDRNAEFAKSEGAVLEYRMDVRPSPAAEAVMRDAASKHGVEFNLVVLE